MSRILAAVFILSLCAIGSARASFGDCDDPDYLGDFGPTPGGASPLGPILQLNCVIEFEFAFDTPGGTRHIRAIRDASADWIVGPAVLADIERGARASVTAMALLGNYRIADVTILMLDDAHATADLTGSGRYVGALTNGFADSAECLVTSFLLGPAGEGERVAYNAAHEIFHCIQAASLSPEQYATAVGGGAWWAEGSAEYFASLALPELGDIHRRADDFNDSIANEEALNAQSYGMAVFFWWFDANRGPGQLMTFLSGMAPSSDAAAQHTAMRDALSDADWLRFAQAYSDRSITLPNGSALALNPPGGEALIFDGNVTRRLALRPFVMVLATAEYACGRWANTRTPATVALSAQDIAGGAWSDYPDEVDARAPANGRYRVAALPTGSDREVRIRAERREGCTPCGGSTALDICLVGSWAQTGGGPVEWMLAQGMPAEMVVDIGPQLVVLEGDGTYWTMPFTGTMDAVITTARDTWTVDGSARAAAGGGRWSAVDGQLAICQDSGGVAGQVTISSSHGSGTMPVNVPGGGELQYAYSCSDAAMQTVLEFAGMSPMVTDYSRLAAGLPESEDPAPAAGETDPADADGRPRWTAGCPLIDPDPRVEDDCDRYRR
ncbi:MAG: hypothetical protein R3F55_23485 [Alphaproteobacteria bacterium]